MPQHAYQPLGPRTVPSLNLVGLQQQPLHASLLERSGIAQHDDHRVAAMLLPFGQRRGQRNASLGPELFANDHEIKALYQTSSFETALDLIRKDCKIAAVTRSEKGSVIVRDGDTVLIKAIPVRELVDTTGAGDLYAAGFLYGYTAGLDLQHCGDLGSLAAGLVIQQIGPRPRQNLRQDLDNRSKAILDCLQHYQVIKNDNLCERLTMCWSEDLPAECVVILQIAEEGLAA